MAITNNSLPQIALQKFKKNLWGVVCFWLVITLIFVAIFGYLIVPDNTKNANFGDISIATKPIGFSVNYIKIPTKNAPKASFINYFTGFPATEEHLLINDYQIKSDTLLYTKYNPDVSLNETKKLPLELFGTTNIETIKSNYILKKTFLLGTDSQGRDLFSRIIIGSRVSLAIGFVAVFISLFVGLFFGSIAGFFGGKIDAFVMMLVNIIWSIPTLLLVIAITLTLGKGFWQVFVAVGLTMWVEVARVVRGQVMSIKEMQYITAARALGYGKFRILVHHILPNCMAPLIVISAANFASAILVESGLSFLGLGAQVPVPSWGGIIKEHYNYLLLGKAHLVVLPGLLMLLTILSFMLIGNALRDALDSKNE